MFEKTYRPARELLGIVRIVGWIVCAIGAIAVVYALSQADELQYMGDIAVLMSLVPGIGGIVLGVVVVAWTQVSTAILDQADISREILKRMDAEPSGDLSG